MKSDLVVFVDAGEFRMLLINGQTLYKNNTCYVLAKIYYTEFSGYEVENLLDYS
jgi:hypothetical protein